MENFDNPDRSRKSSIEQWKPLSEFDVATSVSVENIATELESQGLKAMDALHLASAMEGGCEYFLTTDKHILRKRKNDHRIKVLDPVEFIREIEAFDE